MKNRLHELRVLPFNEDRIAKCYLKTKETVKEDEIRSNVKRVKSPSLSVWVKAVAGGGKET